MKLLTTLIVSMYAAVAVAETGQREKPLAQVSVVEALADVGARLDVRFVLELADEHASFGAGVAKRLPRDSVDTVADIEGLRELLGRHELVVSEMDAEGVYRVQSEALNQGVGSPLDAAVTLRFEGSLLHLMAAINQQIPALRPGMELLPDGTIAGSIHEQFWQDADSKASVAVEKKPVYEVLAAARLSDDAPRVLALAAVNVSGPEPFARVAFPREKRESNEDK